MLQMMGLKSLHDPLYDSFPRLEIDAKTLPLFLPKKVDYTYAYPVVDDQNGIGSCVAYGARKLFEFYHARRKGQHELISARALYASAKALYGANDHTDDGLNVSDGLNVLKQFYVNESDYSSVPNNSSDFPSYLIEAPHDLRKTDFLVQSFVTVAPSVGEMRKALYKHGPILIGMAWPNEFMNVGSDGLLPSKNLTMDGGHCINIVAYDDEKVMLDGTPGGFKIMNNWTTAWGDQGFAWLPYSLEGSQFFPTDIFTAKL